MKLITAVNDMEKDEDKEKKKQQVLFVSQDYILPFRPLELNHEYSVLYTIEKGDKKQTLEQNFSLRRLKPDSSQNEYHFIQIDKISELLVDGKPVDSRAYKVAEKTAELLYPLRIVVNKYGKWVDINSYYKLKERWENQKEAIKELFDGKTFEMLAQNIENAIEDDKSLVGLISGNWFLRAYFNGIHRAYTRRFERERTLYFPAAAEVEDIEFSIVQKVNPYLNDLNLIEVTQSGKSEDENTEEHYHAQYYLNPNNYLIESLHLECDLIDMRRKIKVEVKNLDQSKISIDNAISLLV
ncbi:hypothetical protein PQ462_08140 [Flavobacterium sp. KACC 22758]|uniref:hypothetical protein n=1 Tax=Flavobacterium sp. KACC 22758 TaxID=3025667 RepID=UPI002366F05F|nr:hypothetical protein [Flavobacterium sp. KACC 22758]WDF61333.1 hypothetical protein PQ462_08140 [Flavobacterium sp. KACC 22758]